MKKLIVGIALVVIIVIVLFFSGAFSPLNNYFSNQIPDTSCKVDSDCDILRLPANNIYCTGNKDCRMFEFNSTEIIAANKNWRPYCLPTPNLGAEIMCIGGTRLPQDYMEHIKCINNQCTKVLP
jgi:hypothetical protein